MRVLKHTIYSFFFTNDPPPTSQPTDNNPLTALQDRQRAPQKQLSRCLEDRTRIDLISE